MTEIESNGTKARMDKRLEMMHKCNSCAHKGNVDFDYCHICNNEADMYKPKPTNADRIRAMTDEELAYFLEGTHHDPWNACGRCRWSSCEECCLEWLKEEVKT